METVLPGMILSLPTGSMKITTDVKAMMWLPRRWRIHCKLKYRPLPAKQVDTIVVVTHHLPFQEMVYYPNRLPFDFFSAYMGSEGLGTTILEEPFVKYVICGHSYIKSSH